ncbi:MAG: DNA ligase D [Luteolibacter sp.]
MARKSQPRPRPNARLSKYQSKRNFGKTPEPGEASGTTSGNSYVIQEHHARSHHFDFRLEMDGVLVSWAVPKAIPEETSEKRLAVHVEDHPLDYGSFEGEIPKGNYGAGKVAIWDAGEWHPLGTSWKKGFEKGKLKFRLRGKRLDGTYLLARMGEEPNWLLRRLADEATEEAPPKVARETASFIEPQLARVVSAVPSGQEWCHEIKFDGYRLIAVKHEAQVKLFTRNGHDWTDRFGDLSAHISEVSPNDFVLDGEAVVFEDNGGTSFGGLQEALKGSAQDVVFVAFDLLSFAGENLRDLPLSERVARMETIVAEDGEHVRRSHIWPGSAGKQLFKQACENGLEGIVSKKLNARYIPASRRDWVKSKCRARQEFVICGYTPPKGSRSGFGALVLGSHENGKLVPRGKVGTGFTDQKITDMMKRFKPLVVSKPLFQIKEKGVTWLRPELVAEIEFAEITREGSIRQGSFLGIREDKAADSIHLESVSPNQGSEVSGISISHPDRVVFPDMGITKLEVARYYEKVGELMMPYVADRPLAILRAPEGTGGSLFFQKSFPNHLPKHVDQQQLADGATVFSVSHMRGLVSLAQFGAMEFHPWGSTLDKPDIAEFLTWDLDPDSAVTWKETLGAAFLLRDYLHDLGLSPMVKTSGGKGLHLMLRIRRVHHWDVMKKFAKDVSRNVAAMNPGRFVIVSTKAKRKGKIFIDWMRNGKGSTCIAPWCVRARAGAKVSMPVEWSDLPEVPPQGFSIHEPLVIPDEWRNPKAQSINASMIAAAAGGNS